MNYGQTPVNSKKLRKAAGRITTQLQGLESSLKRSGEYVDSTPHNQQRYDKILDQARIDGVHEHPEVVKLAERLLPPPEPEVYINPIRRARESQDVPFRGHREEQAAALERYHAAPGVESIVRDSSSEPARSSEIEYRITHPFFREMAGVQSTEIRFGSVETDIDGFPIRDGHRRYSVREMPESTSRGLTVLSADPSVELRSGDNVIYFPWIDTAEQWVPAKDALRIDGAIIDKPYSGRLDVLVVGTWAPRDATRFRAEELMGHAGFNPTISHQGIIDERQYALATMNALLSDSEISTILNRNVDHFGGTTLDPGRVLRLDELYSPGSSTHERLSGRLRDSVHPDLGDTPERDAIIRVVKNHIPKPQIN